MLFFLSLLFLHDQFARRNETASVWASFNQTLNYQVELLLLNEVRIKKG